MAYIGVQPTDTYLSIASQQITGNGGATYTLDYSVSNEEDVAVFVNNVRQNVSSYTVSGTSLTLGGTISASDSCWVLFLGRTVGTKTPATGSVTNDMLAGSIATSKLADGSTFATTNGITMADQWRLSADFSLPTSTGDVTTNLERVDTYGGGQFGTAMTESSGIFSFPSTGYYLVSLFAQFYTSANNGNLTAMLKYTSDNSTYNVTSFIQQSTNANSSVSFGSGATSILFDITNTTNQKIKISAGGGPSGTPGVLRGNSDQNRTTVTFIRLGDT